MTKIKKIDMANMVVDYELQVKDNLLQIEYSQEPTAIM